MATATGSRMVFDLETNGLLYSWDAREGRPAPAVMDTVHCMGIINLDSGQEYACVNPKYTRKVGEITIEEGLGILSSASEVSGHNILRFDLPVLKKFYGWEPSAGTAVVDTQIAARCVFPDTRTDDFDRLRRGAPLTPKHIGMHNLEAWGIRLGIHKGTIQKHQGPDWYKTYSEEMLSYCVQDVRVTRALRQLIAGRNPSARMLQLEHAFALIMDHQENFGFAFDDKAAGVLCSELLTQRLRLLEELKNLFPPRVITYKTPKKQIEKQKTIPFNPASRDQIAWNLTNKYKWEPEQFTPAGSPQVDEAILSELEYPEAQKLVEFLTVEKRLGQLAEGKQAWMKLVAKDGRIHGGVITNGTVTGRCSHVGPNMGQVPRVCGKCKLTAPCRLFSTGKVHSPYGAECRGLFTAPPGRVLVGCDASGIQLRMLAHYLAKYDGGEYVELVTKGDPHERNRVAAGLPTRDKAKTFIYAFLFGAGNGKIGKIINGSAAAGKKLIERFYAGLPAIKKLKHGIESIVKMRILSEGRGYLTGLDGRVYPLRSLHVALNVLLMGGEAVIMKQAAVNFDAAAAEAGLVRGVDYGHVAFVHDEFQFETKPEIADAIGKLAAEAIRKAGRDFGLRCPLDAEFRIGANWAATH